VLPPQELGVFLDKGGDKSGKRKKGGAFQTISNAHKVFFLFSIESIEKDYRDNYSL